MDDLLMPPSPEAMGPMGAMDGPSAPTPASAPPSGGMGGPMPPPMPDTDPQSMALAAAEVTMEMLPGMPDQALAALSRSVMAEVDRRSAEQAPSPSGPAPGPGPMGAMPVGPGPMGGMPPGPAPAPAPAGIGALLG